MTQFPVNIADVMEYDNLSCFPVPDIYFSDLPWGNSYVKMFETMMHRDSGIERPGNNMSNIADKFFSIIRNDRPVIVEFSIKGHEDLINLAEQHGHSIASVSMPSQTNGKKYAVIQFNTNDPANLSNCIGFQEIDAICQHYKPSTVIDLFAGIGKTTQRFLLNGVLVYGSELNPARFEKLKSIINKKINLYEEKHS